MARLRKVLAITGAVLVGLAATGWVATHPQTRDPYAFLDGRPVVDVIVSGPGSWPATEIRAYSWRGSWESVAKAARAEMPRFGLIEREHRTTAKAGASWTLDLIDGGPCGTNSEKCVDVFRGRFTMRTDRDPLTDNDPEWVTVLASNFLDESWVTVLRYKFFGFGD